MRYVHIEIPVVRTLLRGRGEHTEGILFYGSDVPESEEGSDVSGVSDMAGPLF